MTSIMTNGATSQATAVEQARAIAEVAGALRYAQDNPRDEDLAVARAKRSCQRLEFAQMATFRYRRGGEAITGPTIQFALEIARCWGNVYSGTHELARHARESEMVAFAWDLETNSQRRSTFVNPHTGYVDTVTEEKGARVLRGNRDIRENNQSAGSRVEREMILAVLPSWFVEMCKTWVAETVKNQGAGKPIEDRRRELVERFETYGVRRSELIAKVGAPVDQWLEVDLASLIVIGRALARDETTVEEEFRRDVAADAAPRVTVGQLDGSDTSGANRPENAPTDSENGSTAQAVPASSKTVQDMLGRFNAASFGGRTKEQRQARLTVLSALLERHVDAPDNLTEPEAQLVISQLDTWGEDAADAMVAILADADRPKDDPTTKESTK